VDAEFQFAERPSALAHPQARLTFFLLLLLLLLRDRFGVRTFLCNG
jgi:hypothetical protein